MKKLVLILLLGCSEPDTELGEIYPFTPSWPCYCQQADMIERKMIGYGETECEAESQASEACGDGCVCDCFKLDAGISYAD